MNSNAKIMLILNSSNEITKCHTTVYINIWDERPRSPPFCNKLASNVEQLKLISYYMQFSPNFGFLNISTKRHSVDIMT